MKSKMVAFCLLCMALSACQPKAKQAAEASEDSAVETTTKAATDPSTSTAPQSTAVYDIHASALDGKLADVQAALKAGTKVDKLDPDGRTPLMYASYNGHVAVMKELVSAGAELDIQDKYGRTSLMLASSGDFPDAVHMLLEKGAKPNLVDVDQHFTALMVAAAEGQVAVIHELLNYNADPDMVDVDDDTALNFAKQKNQMEAVKVLTPITKKQKNKK
ncbi:MAG: ankyrin repeat domain-containing protein [Massilibacteroides sp.]|nr:ankyrin repeat domain-containing protein [Massilibacteroides sp.]